MGMTPLEGSGDGTRAGDLDPGVLLELLRAVTEDAQLDTAAQSRSRGWRGSLERRTSGRSSVVRRRATRSVGWRSAVCASCAKVYRRLRRRHGRSRRDCVHGRSGENSALVRHRCLQRLDFLARCSMRIATATRLSHRVRQLAEISGEHSRVHCSGASATRNCRWPRRAALLARSREPADECSIPIAVSARHAHLSQDHARSACSATVLVWSRRGALSQKGQYSADRNGHADRPRGVDWKKCG